MCWIPVTAGPGNSHTSLDADRCFQLWEESRLPETTWQKWQAHLAAAPPASKDEFTQTLATHLEVGRPSDADLQIKLSHRPTVVARSQKLINFKVNATRDPLARGTAADKRATGSAAPAPGDSAAQFDFMLRRRTSPLWIGWREGAQADDFKAEMQQLQRASQASDRFALDLTDIENTGGTYGYLFVFDLPVEASPRIPTLADAVTSATKPGRAAYWHRYFLPAPPGRQAGVLRDLSFPSAEAQRLAGHPNCLSEAVMAPLPTAAPLKPRLSKPLLDV